MPAHEQNKNQIARVASCVSVNGCPRLEKPGCNIKAMVDADAKAQPKYRKAFLDVISVKPPTGISPRRVHDGVQGRFRLGLYWHNFMKADLRISIKKYHRKKPFSGLAAEWSFPLADSLR
jgi:hypothetical protein